MPTDKLKQEALAALGDDRPKFGKLNEVILSGWGTPGQMVAAGILVLVFTLAFVAGIVLWKADPNDTSRGLRNTLFGVGAATTGMFGLFCIVRGFMTWGKQFTRGNHWLIFDKGLVVFSDGEAKSYRWEKIEIWHKLATINRRQYRITVGKKSVPVSLRGDLVATMYEYQMQVCLPELAERTQENEMIDFGPLQVGCESMSYRASKMRYDQIRKLNFSYDVPEFSIILSVDLLGGGTVTIPLTQEVPNVWLCMHLVRGYRKKLFDEGTVPDFLR